MFADAKVQHSAIRVAGEHPGLPVGRQEAWLALWSGVVGLSKVSRAAPQFGHLGNDRVKHLSGGSAGGDALGIGGPIWQLIVPAGAELVSGKPLIQRLLLWIGGGPLVVRLLPFLLGLGSPFDQFAGVLDHLI